MINGTATLLRMVSSYGGYGGGMDMGMGMEESGITGIGFIDSALNWILSQPQWLSALILVTIIVLVAWISGWIIGKIYISIRYPNPEKPQYLSPVQKIVVLVVCAAIVGTLLSAFMKSTDDDTPIDNPMDPGMVEGYDPGMMDPGMGEGSDPVMIDEDDHDADESELPEDDFEGDSENTEGDVALPESPGIDGGNITINPGSGSGGGNAIAVPMPAIRG